MNNKFITTLIVIATIALGIILSVFIPFDKAIALGIIVIGAWLLVLGFINIGESIAGHFSTTAVYVWWGGFCVSLGTSWFIYRIATIKYQVRLSIFVFLICIIITLLLTKLRNKTR